MTCPGTSKTKNAAIAKKVMNEFIVIPSIQCKKINSNFFRFTSAHDGSRFLRKKQFVPISEPNNQLIKRLVRSKDDLFKVMLHMNDRYPMTDRELIESNAGKLVWAEGKSLLPRIHLSETLHNSS